MDLAIGLFFCPACAGYEEKFGIGTDGLRALRGSAKAGDGGAGRGELDRDLLDLSGGGLAGVCGMRAGIEEQEPGTGLAGEDGFNALAIEPAGCFDSFCAANGCDVGIDEAAQAMGYACGYSGKTGASWGKDDSGASCAARASRAAASVA